MPWMRLVVLVSNKGVYKLALCGHVGNILILLVLDVGIYVGFFDVTWHGDIHITFVTIPI